MRRLFGTCLAVGLTLLYSRAASATPSLEVSTTLGGASASELLVRVANPDAKETSGVLELRRSSEERVVAREPFSVPAHATRYIRLPSERGRGDEAFAVTSEGTFRGQERFSGEGGQLVFDIPPQDSERLHDFRVHMRNNIVVAHAVFDEATGAPVLTRRAAVYDDVALVMVRASVFAGLPAPERAALTAWVRTGGAIALSFKDNDFTSIDHDLGVTVGSRLRPAEFGVAADLGLGRVYVLPLDPWTGEANGGLAVQEKLASIVEDRRMTNHMLGEPLIGRTPVPSLDPNRGYRSVLAFAGVLLVAQALISAIAFRRLAIRRGMGPAYRFVVGSSALSFAAVIGLGIYGKGGFGARARELSFVDAASGESVAWVQRRRTYFSGRARTVAVTPRDASNELGAGDAHTMLRVDDASGAIVLDGLAVRPWETTIVTERGITTVGGGVTVGSTPDGDIVVHNATGSVLRNVIVAKPDGHCLAFGEIANGADKTSRTPQSCLDFGPAWSEYEISNLARPQQLLTPVRLVLLGQIEEDPTSLGDFALEKRTTVLRVTGGAS